VLERLEALDLAYLEQPLPADRLVGSAGWAAASRTPVALDESVAGPGAAEAALALGAGSVLNVKPARVGGIRAAVEVVAVARAAGAGWFVGGMLETGVGRAAALAVACLPGPAFPTDLGPSARYVADDLTEPLVADASGRVVPADGPGIGVTPRPDRLDACTRRRAVLRAGGGAGPGR
jgi:O-succinylbenzoate synthase